MSKAPKNIANSWLTEPRVDNQNTVGETLTQREHAADCDINVQIQRFLSLGVSPHRPFDESDCADLSELSTSLIEANNVIQAAREAFDDLDDQVKRRFSGSPALFLDFMGDLEHNYDEAVALGLLVPRSPPSSSPAEQKPPKGASEAPDGASQGQGA